MSYIDTWTAANDATFQGRCRAALWDVANRAGRSEPGFPAAGQEAADPADDDTYIKRVLTEATSITDRELAVQVLRNQTIAGDPLNDLVATDGLLQYEINENWATLRELG